MEQECSHQCCVSLKGETYLFKQSLVFLNLHMKKIEDPTAKELYTRINTDEPTLPFQSVRNNDPRLPKMASMSNALKHHRSNMSLHYGNKSPML